MPRARRRAFIWVKRDQTTSYTLKIDGTDYTVDALAGGKLEFSKAVCPDVGRFKFSLENSAGNFSEKFVGGEVVQLFLDFVDGSTKRFEGKLERVQNVLGGSGYVLRCDGSHLVGELLDITVTESYTGTLSITDILKDIVDKYLSGYTYDGVGTFTDTPALNWQNKPFWDCVNDLCGLAGADCVVSDDKDFHMFKRGSIISETEAAVWNDTLISIEGLGTDTIEVRNKVIVYGKDVDGAQIIYSTTDAASETSFGIKEKVVKDDDIKTYAQAKERGDAELVLLKDTSVQGKVVSWVLPSLLPGEKLWVVSPHQKIHDNYRAVTITHKFPDEITEIEIERAKSIPKLFKDRFAKELALENIQNINRLDHSYNLSFNDFSDIDTSASTNNLGISGGEVFLETGSTATLISKAQESLNNVSQAEVRLRGETLGSALVYVSVEEPANWQLVNLNSLTSIVGVGSRVRVKVELNSAISRIGNVVVLYK